MGLAERLAHAPKGRGHTCTLGILLATWPVNEGATEDYSALIHALESPDWNGTDIARVLADEGRTVNLRHVQIHRRGDCTSGTCPIPQVGRQR